MISLEYSEKNIPFIDLDGYGRLVFSKITSHPRKGYKFLCYNRSYMEDVRVKKVSNGEVVEKFVKSEGRHSYTFDMTFHRKTGQQVKGIPRGTIPPRLGDWLRKTFGKYLTEDKYFPYDNMRVLKNYLARQSIDKIISKPQRKRRKVKKNV